MKTLDDLLKINPSAFVLFIDDYGGSKILTGTDDAPNKFALFRNHWYVIDTLENIEKDKKLSKCKIEELKFLKEEIKEKLDQMKLDEKSKLPPLYVFYDTETVLLNYSFNVYQVGWYV